MLLMLCCCYPRVVFCCVVFCCCVVLLLSLCCVVVVLDICWSARTLDDCLLVGGGCVQIFMSNITFVEASTGILTNKKVWKSIFFLIEMNNSAFTILGLLVCWAAVCRYRKASYQNKNIWAFQIFIAELSSCIPNCRSLYQNIALDLLRNSSQNNLR